MQKSWRLAVVALACGGGALGCHHRQGSHTTASLPAADSRTIAPKDSMIGNVSVTGTSFEQRIVLRKGDSTMTLTLTTEDSAALARLGGAEVSVRGIAQKDGFVVRSFVVRAVDGAPVADGVLDRRDGHFVLYTTDGRIPLGNPPAAFDSLVHARVWVGGPIDTGPNVYGIITTPQPPLDEHHRQH